MNQFAISDSVDTQSLENFAGNTALLEAYEPASGSRPLVNQIGAQTENLVNSGVLPDMPIDGLSGQSPLQQFHETASVRKPSRYESQPAESGEICLENISEATVERGLELAELIESGVDGRRVVDLIRQGLASGDLKGMILTANIELERGENPAQISSGIGREEMTYVAEDSSTVPNKIEQYNPRAAISVSALALANLCSLSMSDMIQP